jgi:hypothetical protein
VRLRLYEEIMLLALSDDKGTVVVGFSEMAVVVAVLAELLLEKRIVLAEARRRLVEVEKADPTGDPIIDECLSKMARAKRRASLQSWITRLSSIRQLRHTAAPYRPGGTPDRSTTSMRVSFGPITKEKSIAGPFGMGMVRGSL